VSYVAQGETKDVEKGEFAKWEAELLRPPAGYARTSRKSYVAPALDAMMAPPRSAA
jgi:hypothetical protein